MKKVLGALFLAWGLTQSAAAAWWDDWQFENKWVDHHGWSGPADGGEGHPQAFRTGPGSRDKPFKWVRNMTIQKGVNSTLHLQVTTCDYGGKDDDWDLKIIVNGQPVFTKRIVMSNGWQTFNVDLSAYDGQNIRLEMWNAMDETDWWDWAMWDNVGFSGSGGIPSGGGGGGGGDRVPGPAVKPAEQPQKAPREVVLPLTAPPDQKKVQIPPQVLDDWQARLCARLNAAVKAGKKPAAYVHVGNKTGKYDLAGADEKNLLVALQGNALPVSWKNLSAADRIAVAKALLEGDDDVPGLLCVSVFLLSDGQTSQGEEYLAKATLKDAKAADGLKASLAPAK